MTPETNSHISAALLGGVACIIMGMLIFHFNLFHNRTYDWLLLLAWTILVLYAVIEKEIYLMEVKENI